MPKVEGKFDITLAPLQQEKDLPQSMRFTKRYAGPIQGTGRGQMLSHKAESGSAGYVAIEKINATIDDKKGSFVVQHAGIMDQQQKRLVIEVIPDSGTEGLHGISGQMTIDIIDGNHYYTFDYTFDGK